MLTPTRRQFCAAALALTAAALQGGCDRGTAVVKPAAARRTRVLVGPAVLADSVRRVGGEHVVVEWLLDAGQRVESLENTPDLRQRGAAADLVLAGGPWDEWATAGQTNEARAARVLSPELMPSAPRGDAGAPDDRAYAWLDPLVVRDLVDRLRELLTVREPRLDETFRGNAAAYAAELTALDAELRDALAPVAGRRVPAVRPVWGALCARYGLAQLAPLDLAATEQSLSAADYKAVAAAAGAGGARAVFVDAATPAAVRQEIGRRTGLRAVPLDPVGSSAPDGPSTYAKLMRYNAGQLVAGLG